MKINYFDSEASILEFENKFISLRPFLLVSDTISFGGNSPWVKLFNVDVDTFSDQMTIDITKLIYAKSETIMADIAKYEEIYPIIKKTKNKKHLDRGDLNMIGYIKKGIKILKDDLKTAHNEFLEIYNIAELKRFNNDNIWQLLPIDCINHPTKEDVFIHPISETIIGRDSILGMDGIIDELFTFTLLVSADEKTCDFIKIPLWDFPKLDELNYAQLKYTRDDLQSALSPFRSQLKELSDSIFSLPFTIENQTQIKHLYKRKLNSLIKPIQNSIDESLYMSQMKNKFGENTELKFCLGIASAETLIDYYKKTETILPYVADEIKQRVARQIDLKASYVFTYFDLYKGGNHSE
jgi:hypothetical protein